MAPARAVVGSGPSRGGSTAPGSESGATDPPLSPLGPSPPRGACDAREPPAHNTPAPPPPSSSPLSTDTLALGPHAPVLRRHPPSLPASRVLGTTAAHPDGGGDGDRERGGRRTGGGRGERERGAPRRRPWWRARHPVRPSIRPSNPLLLFPPPVPRHGPIDATPRGARSPAVPSPHTPHASPIRFSSRQTCAMEFRGRARGNGGERRAGGGRVGLALYAHTPLSRTTHHRTSPRSGERGRPPRDPARPGPDALAPPQHPLSPPPASPRSLRAIAHTTPARMLGFFTRRTPWAADGTVSRRPPCACVGLSRPRVSAWLFCWSGCEKGTLMRPPLQRSSSAARSSTTTTTSLFSPALPHRPPPPAIARAPSPLPHPRPLSPHRHPTPSPTPPSTLTPHRVASALTHAYMHTRPSLLGAPAAGPSQPSPPPSHPSAALLSFSPSPSPSHPRSPLFPISPLPPPSTLIDGLLRHHHHQPPITISRRRPDGDPRCSRGRVPTHNPVVSMAAPGGLMGMGARG